MKSSPYSILITGFLGASAAQAMQPNPEMNQEPMGVEYSVHIEQGENDQCGLQDALEKMQEDSSYLAKLKEQSADNPNIRISGPAQPMTMDFRPERLTIVVDEEKKTISMRCV